MDSLEIDYEEYEPYLKYESYLNGLLSESDINPYNKENQMFSYYLWNKAYDLSEIYKGDIINHFDSYIFFYI